MTYIEGHHAKRGNETPIHIYAGWNCSEEIDQENDAGEVTSAYRDFKESIVMCNQLKG